ncbi:MAG: hypothetical protein AAGC71_15725 [Pseudomonadota bacterium]
MSAGDQVLNIGSVSLPIASATLTAGLPDPYWCDTYNNGHGKDLRWRLEIRAQETQVDDDYWAPVLYVEHLAFPTRDWCQLETQEYVWDQPFDKYTSEPNGGFYVFEHANIGKGRLRFVGRDGRRFAVRWDGLCDIHWNATFGSDVAFSLAAQPTFTHVFVDGSERDTSATLRARLDTFLNVADFD